MKATILLLFLAAILYLDCVDGHPAIVVQRNCPKSAQAVLSTEQTNAEDGSGDLYDALIIGGGPSGLQAGMSFGRLDRRVVMFDSGVYRNQATRAMHDVVALDGSVPSDFRSQAHKQLERYPAVDYQRTKITSVRNNGSNRTGGYFEAQDENGKAWRGKYLVLATGVQEQLPSTEGFADIWGVSAFWCLWCDGWEHRDRSIAFVGTEHIVNDALIGTHLFTNVTVLTDGIADYPFPPAYAAQSIVVNTRKIASYAHVHPWRDDSPVLITFADGSVLEVGGIVTTNPKTPGSDFGVRLGVCHYEDNPVTMVADEKRRTNVPGVYAVGDAGSTVKNVPAALAGAKSAAVDVIVRLAMEEAEGMRPEWTADVDCAAARRRERTGFETMEEF